MAVKDSKLQRLTTSFEEIKMEEDESFNEFYTKLKDIVNSVFNLGKTIPEPKIVRKVLRLLERCSDLYPKDFMPRSLRLRNQRILIKFF